MSSSNKPIIAVVGATGVQGASVINAFLSTNLYHVRGLTRNPSSEKAKELSARGVEVMQADLNEYESVKTAFEGASIIYALTNFFEPFLVHGIEQAISIEEAQGKTLALAASQTPTLKHYIWSTLPNPAKISNGKYDLPHFTGKNRADKYIKSLPELLSKTTFLWIGYYATNYILPVFQPSLIKFSGKYIHLSPISSSGLITTIGSPSDNIGVFVLSIVKQPSLTLPGKFVLASTETLTNGEILKIWGEVTGRETVYVKVGLDQFDQLFEGWGKEVGLMMSFWEEMGEGSWGGEEGVVTREILGIKEEELVGVKGALEGLKWE